MNGYMYYNNDDDLKEKRKDIRRWFLHVEIFMLAGLKIICITSVKWHSITEGKYYEKVMYRYLTKIVLVKSAKYETKTFKNILPWDFSSTTIKHKVVLID